MTNAELVALKNDVIGPKASVVFQGDTLLNWWTLNGGQDQVIADFYNQTVIPAVLIWRPNVMREELIRSLDGAVFVSNGWSAAQRALFQIVCSTEILNATDANTRAQFSAMASGAQITTWTAVSRRNATYCEALFSGAPVSGASISARFNYQLSAIDVSMAHNV